MEKMLKTDVYKRQLIDRSADCTKAVVAVGQHIRNGETLKTGCSGSLDDSNVGDVVGRHRVELDFELVHIPGGVVRL